jgi:hypothetical protein
MRGLFMRAHGSVAVGNCVTVAMRIAMGFGVRAWVDVCNRRLRGHREARRTRDRERCQRECRQNETAKTVTLPSQPGQNVRSSAHDSAAWDLL